ncbi:class I SAM-dependent methyltransferase [Chitinophaga pendula]|uniref:class I SAM-dependent methyltransferase n=1 Tax=Chitinophaga TaxID=79328 RepID=UPI000BB03510|nr:MULTISPECIES: class I SAM-dependent methyltransferase [Chitinophaga]ASZ13651.1 SAM-dependent methyltransferase [Chitinophaga sp. MD30]UCJ08724.1 class I SAM-dependent methyltransferase [Chitinophaga pendula]
MKRAKLVSETIEQFYSETYEEIRLEVGLGPLEFERNKELIQRFLPAKGGAIADIGGGPGVYAAWMAKLGHEVILFDPVPKHVEQANKRSAKSKKRPFKALLGEARQLDLPDNTTDVAILHGPLYHLQQEEDRIAAIREAQRILKPGGIFLGFAINYTASTLVGLFNGHIYDPAFLQMCREELSSGVHNAPGNWPGILPEAYYHRPPQLTAEVTTTGLSHIDTFAVEGIAWMDSKYFEHRSDPLKNKQLMELLRLTENHPEMLAMSPHMMIAARK